MRSWTVTWMGWSAWAVGLAACSSAPTPSGGDAVVAAQQDAGVNAEVAPATDAQATADAVADAAAIDAGPPDAKPAKPPTPLPQLSYLGGNLLLTPTVVTVTFPGDPYEAKLSKFAATLVTSPWWQVVSAGYCLADGGACIGPGIDGGHVVLPFAPSPSYQDDIGGESTLQPMLKNAIAAAQLPAPVTDTVYIVYLPKGVEVTQSGEGYLATSCKQFGGYHFSMDVAGKQVAYAVIPECPGNPSQSTLDLTTIAASHELIEAATDPYTVDNGQGPYPTGFILDPSLADNLPWYMALGGVENADLCPVQPWDAAPVATVAGFMVSRSWSNPAAKAGHDPCQPAPEGETYFNVAPAKGQSHLQLKVGESATIDLHAFADGPVPDGWHVYGADMLAMYAGSKQPKYVSVAFGDADSVEVHAGDIVQATVTLLKNPKSVSPGGAVLLLMSTDTDVAKNRFWPIRVQAK